ncbi:MAG: hypothetical protein A3G37_01090 [Omnitrophica WOR_2 bacterium RIFCSPLOWO2_12_FULL_46_30]|nr:MAG: hypothetical protein A3H41_03280 [Omnitrophica WOR_2 bacterium RIFCSPLOWO2_02_FULL_45_28]OGX51739.1 MAG: hypothetical protein A3G37_01090 [Omnitrophica WOR_2 bacterium RIFCSPLOWO2_12_FULL_46_30]
MVLKGFLQPLFLSIGFLSVIVVYFRYIERHSVFYPAKEIEYSPKELGLDFEEVFFKTSDNIELNGWFVPAADASYCVLFCHGNAGNISHRVEKLKFFNELGVNVFIFDYRGYGKSKGRPNELGVYLDVKGAYDYLLSRKILPEQIIGYGESIGTAVIIDLAEEYKLSGLIIDSAMSSAKDMVKTIYPFLPYWVFSSRFDSENKIKSIGIPKLIIHSINDEIVPFRLGRKLYDNALEPKEFLQIHGGHNSCFFESENILKAKVADFLKRLSE